MFQFELEAAETQGATSGLLLPSNSSTILTAGAAQRGKGEHVPHLSTVSASQPCTSPLPWSARSCQSSPSPGEPGQDSHAAPSAVVPCAPPLLRAHTHLPQCLNQLWLPARDEATLLLKHNHPSSYKDRFCFSYSG